MSNLNYIQGFGAITQSEALEGALPKTQNSPQKAPYGLYPEQLSGSAFTAPRHKNNRTWFYRIRPSVLHGEFRLIQQNKLLSPPFSNTPPTPNQLRWDPLPYPGDQTDFIHGLTTILGHGSVASQSGAAIHLYAINQSMTTDYFYNADGDFMIVPQEGDLMFHTECGPMEVSPGDVAVIPRGIKFQVQLKQEKARGYVCENFGAPFQLPERGPIGANSLAEERHFQTPTAHYRDEKIDGR